jgi:hypothetical protein
LLGIDRQAYYYQPAVNETEEVRLKLHLNAITRYIRSGRITAPDGCSTS